MWTAILVIAIVIAGCASTPQKLGTASGLPEVTITGANARQIQNRLVEAMVASGATMKTINDHQAVFAKRF